MALMVLPMQAKKVEADRAEQLAQGFMQSKSNAVVSPLSAKVLNPSHSMNSSVDVNLASGQDKRLPVIRDKDSGLSEKMLVPNAEKIRQSLPKQNGKTLRSSADTPVDLGNGMFLLSDVTDPNSTLLEVKVDANQWSSIALTGNLNELQNISNLIYKKFNDDFDFIFFVLNTPLDNNIVNNLGFYGINLGIGNDVQGIGINTYNDDPIWGSDGKLKSAMFFPFYDAILTGPALHELCHNWAAYIKPTPYLPDNTPINESSAYQSHWGISNAGGQLGGFKYVRTVQENCDGVAGKTLYQASMNSETNPDGSFVFGGFGVNANGGNGLPYSDIELYLMGLKSAQELRDANFSLDIYSGNDYNYDGDLSFGDGYFYSNTKKSYTIDDIIALNGARVPDASVSQKQFKILTVAITPEMATDDYCEDIIKNVSWFAGALDDNTYQGWIYNFRQATNNAGSLIVSDIKNSFKLNQLLTLSNINVSAGTLSPAFNKYVYDYTLRVDASVATIDITGITDTPGATVSGNAIALPLKLNDFTDTTITVSNEKGDSQSYSITIVRGKVPPVSITWDMDNAGVVADFYLGVAFGELCTIDWGDSSKETITGNGGIFWYSAHYLSHTYNASGSYQVTIQGEDGKECPVIALHHNMGQQVLNYRITKINLHAATQLVAMDVRCTANTELDVNRNKKLLYLYWEDGKLTSLDISQNTELSALLCDQNMLTDLDVSQNKKLEILCFDNNKITAIDVSKNLFLWQLYCEANPITDLDVSLNRYLAYLDVRGLQLTHLDLSNNIALVDLYAYGNQFTELDVSHNKTLRFFECMYNQLTELDVSKNPVMTELWCQNNHLKDLDVSNNTVLEKFYCYENQLTHLDVSKNTALAYLTCDNNQLTELDVSKNPAITQLWCQNNHLTDLDVSNNTVLETFYCNGNQLTYLDVSSNPALTDLQCQSNAIPLINLYTLAQQAGNITTKNLGQQTLPDSTIFVSTSIAIDTVFYGVNTTCNYPLDNGKITFSAPGDYPVTISNPALLDGSVQQTFHVVQQGTGVGNVPPSKSLEAWMQNGMLHVSGLTAGQSWRIYNASGELVYQSIANGEQADIPLFASGVYLIQSGGKTVKVIKE